MIDKNPKPATPARLAGKAGGLTTSKRHGPEYFRMIGKLGGLTTKKRHGSAHYSRMGKIGGKTTDALPAPTNDDEEVLS